MFNIRINRWLNGFRKYLFTYREGYFDLPYLSNSPDLMIESLKQMPFTRLEDAQNTIYTDNIFTDGAMRYRELEEGLWVIITELEFKKNVSTHALYDKEVTDYHFLSHFIYNSPVSAVGINGITIPSHGWGFYKPGTEIKAYFNKGDKGVFTNFAFSATWFERNMPMNQLNDQHSFKQFFKSGYTYKTWENMVPGSDIVIDQVLAILKTESEQPGGLIPLKLLCLQLISAFFISMATVNQIQPLAKMHDHDSRLVARAEKILVDNLTTVFPGVDELAKTLNTSTRKLQTLFKTINGNSIYQYYQQKQMVLAYQILKANHKSLKDIALTFGYQNPSKFSAAFKKYHKVLPSEI